LIHVALSSNINLVGSSQDSSDLTSPELNAKKNGKISGNNLNF
jgi:hypothetical protein